ncbi:mechanosensitive ion channel domain-containing protein [Candidatus Dependentiae bacterium]
MKKLNTLSFLFLMLVCGQIFGGALIKGFKEGMAPDKIFTTAIDEKKKQLKSLQEELKKLEGEVDAFLVEVKTRFAEIATQINIIRGQIKKEPQNEEFLNSKLSVLNELYTALKDMQLEYEQLAKLIEDHIQALEDYLEDPNFEQYLKEYRADRRQIYSFTDLQTLNKTLIDHKIIIQQIEEQEKNANAELANRSASVSSAQRAYQRKQEDLRAFVESPETRSPEEMFGFDTQQKIELLSLQEQLLYEKSKLADLRLVVTRHKVDKIKTSLFIAKLQLNVLEKTVEIIRPLVKVRDEEVAEARAQLNKRRQQSLLVKGKYRRDEEVLAKENEQKMQELKKLGGQHNIALDAKLDQWSLEPKQTVMSYLGLCVVGNVNTQYLLVERKRELRRGLIALEEAKLRDEELEVEVKSTFQGIADERFASEEVRNREIKKYSAPKSEIGATISRFKERENAIKGVLSAQRRARDNIQNLIEDVQKKRATVFKNNTKEYNRCILWLRDSQARVQQQIDVIEKAISVYHDIVATSEEAIKQVSFIAGELVAIGIFYRPEYAIKLEEVKNVIPDIKRFATDLQSYVSRFSFTILVNKIKESFPRPIHIFWLLVKLFALLLGLLIFRFYVHRRLYRWLARLQDYRGLRLFSLLSRALLDFIMHYFFLISLWLILFALIKFGVLPDRSLQIIFYLISIPYFLFLASRLLARFIAFNVSHDYVMLARQFQPRFSFIFSILLYATIIILCFKQAFELGTYQDSQLPAILLALNFIILQVCLIFLITKEQILSLIPTKTETWKKIHAQVDKFFYLILAFIVAIIIMINPYVGFGRLVLHVLSRLMLTILFLPLFFWLQSILKKISSRVFFSIDEEAVKERFSSAKSWYGLSVIVMFLALILVGLVLGARIWGWPTTFKNIVDWVRSPMFFGEGGKPISAISFVYIIAYIVAGFLLAFAFNKFVLRRIFDLLLVEMGIQQAVVGVTRYLIIIAVIIVGLENIGLGPMTKWLLATIIAIGWVVKEPLGDLVAYFILLIQRPLKIGDYIQIDENTSGVVRRITPRSIVIRQKNSTTIVVPNSQVLTKAVTNWNYVSGFIAVNDILVNAPYKEDPDKVLEIIRTAVESHQNILKSPQAIIRLENFGQYSFVFLVRAYVSSHYTLDMWNIASDLRLLIIRALRSNGIDIAVPVQIMMSPKGKQIVVKEGSGTQEPPTS